MTSDEVVYNNPILSYVKLEDLLVRPDITEIENQDIIAENITFTWLEICNHAEQNYFTNKKVIDNLKARYPEEYYKKIYKAREVITYYDYESNNKPKRIVITYLVDEKILVRAITFPYIHRKPYYIFYYIKRVPGSIYGEGLAERLKYTSKALVSLWNQTVDSGTLRNAPVFKGVKPTNFDPTVKKWYPGAIWWLEKITDIETLQVFGQSPEILNIISRLERYAEWQTGVTAYATGRESSLDPNAPASKAFMLLQESNIRLNKMIRQLHKSNKKLYAMVDKLIYQHTKHNKIPYLVMKGDNIEHKSITKKILGLKVNYIPHLTDITANKEEQRDRNLKFGSYLMPFVGKNPVAVREILKIQMMDMGGLWEKNIDKILPAESSAQQTPPLTNIQSAPANNILPTLPFLQNAIK